MNRSKGVDLLAGALMLSTVLLTVGEVFAAGGQVVELSGGKQFEIYVVKRGDTVWKIAEKLLENPKEWRSIVVPDRFVSTNPNLIYPGQLLLVPAAALAVEKTAEARKPAAEEERPVEPDRERLGSVAVGRFKNKGTGDQHAWLSVGIAEALSSDLAKVPGARVVEREQVERVLAEKKLVDAGIVEGDSARDLERKLAADHLVTGAYEVRFNGLIDIAAAVADSSGTRVAEASVSGKLERLFEMERLLLLQLFGRTFAVDDDARAAILAGEKTSLDAFEEVSKGAGLRYAGRSKEAREHYRKALERDPRYQQAATELKESLSGADTVAVMPFKNASGQSSLDWISLGMAESMTTDLQKLTSVTFIERVQIDKALEELKLGTMGGLVDEKTAPKLGKMTGAGILLLGSYQIMDSTLRADVRLVDAASGLVLHAETATGGTKNIFEVETKLAERIAAAFHAPVAPDQGKRLLAEKPDMETFKRQIMARGGFEVVSEGSKGKTQIKTVALTNFDNAGANAEYAWLQAAIPGALTTDLKKNSRLALAERSRIDKALEELKLGASGLVPPSSAPQLGRLIGADAVLTGMYQLSGDTIRIDAKVIRVETGEVLTAGQASGPVQNIFAVERKLADEIIAALDARAPKKEEETPAKKRSEPAEDSETALLARKAYKFELAAGHKDKIRHLISTQQALSSEETLNRINTWLMTVRGTAAGLRPGMALGEGEFAPLNGYLFTREHLDKMQFLKDERDLCIEAYDKKTSEKK